MSTPSLDESRSMVMQNMFRAFEASKHASESGTDSDIDAALLRTRSLIEENQSHEQQCYVCLDVIAPSSPVWSCEGCYTIFDLACIQGWAKQCRAAQAAAFVPKDDAWYCPNCRRSYKPQETSLEYQCFCKKELNPQRDAWLAPHSCGQLCGAELGCAAGHTCQLLCHPGPHPLCALTVEATCFCGEETTRRRCINSAYSCGKICGSVLGCREHRCPLPCHAGECPPCQLESKQKCRCGKTNQMHPCAKQGLVRCETKCNKPLDCGRHVCENICCDGSCGHCPLNGARKCPCGKESYDNLPCDQPTPLCGHTCNKWLSCEKHRCTRPCHRGDCGECVLVESLPCRCGAKTKKQGCGAQEWKCDLRCNEMRNCGRHKCRKRCCIACPPCEEICGKSLSCNNHRCELQCHEGDCSKCPGVSIVACTCGKTKRKVMCGKERTTPIPKCNHPCSLTRSCHHGDKISPNHPCHPPSQPCPPCDLPCEKPSPNKEPEAHCTHKCQMRCHDRPPPTDRKAEASSSSTAAPTWPAVADKNKSATTPAASPKNAETAAASSSTSSAEDPFACPPCLAAVTRTCLGLHGNKSMVCSDPPKFSCEKNCGQVLKCGNHHCERPCHEIKQVSASEASKGLLTSVLSGCKQCEQKCSRKREGLLRPCSHGCQFGCHNGKCPSCEMVVTLACACGNRPVVLTCNEYTTMAQEELDHSLRCEKRCTNRLACGHLCPNTCCTPGQCLPEAECSKKVVVKCSCGARKEEKPCSQVQKDKKNGQSGQLECEEECRSKKSLARSTSEESKQQQQEEVVAEEPSSAKAAPESKPIKRTTSTKTTAASSSSSSSSASSKKSTTASSVAAAAPLSTATMSYFDRSQTFSWLSSRVKLSDKQLEKAVRYLMATLAVIVVALILYVVLVM